jgi:hypothetical protein
MGLMYKNEKNVFKDLRRNKKVIKIWFNWKGDRKSLYSTK